MSVSRHCRPVERPHLAGVLGVLAVAVLVLSTSACNTVSGVGQDIQAAGDALSDTAEDVKEWAATRGGSAAGVDLGTPDLM
jgi:entericidin B